MDNDHSAISQRLVNKIAASTYFRLVEVPASYEEGLRNCGFLPALNISLVNLWHSAGRSFSIDLLFRSSFRSGNVRFRTCYFQLLGNDATVYVCYVVLFVGCNFDEWFVYSH